MYKHKQNLRMLVLHIGFIMVWAATHSLPDCCRTGWKQWYAIYIHSRIVIMKIWHNFVLNICTKHFIPICFRPFVATLMQKLLRFRRTKKTISWKTIFFIIIKMVCNKLYLMIFFKIKDERDKRYILYNIHVYL